MYRAYILKISDQLYFEEANDQLDQGMVELLSDYELLGYDLVPGDYSYIRERLEGLVGGVDLIITLGGTGFSKRDQTPRASLDIIDRRLHGLEVKMMARFFEAGSNPLSLNGICGISGGSLLINLPDDIGLVRLGLEEILGPVREVLDKLDLNFKEGRGRVSLVGGGPGALDLITRRGELALKAADVIVYDRYISQDFLNLNQEAEKIFVGKIGGGDFVPQEEICEILYKKALEGKHVVRLKGGDPFVFGRGGEEVLYLKERGIETRIIPGVSSSISALGLNNIPITHRGVARSFTVLTAQSLDQNLDHINWQALKDLGGTLVFLMGRGKRKEIAAKLIGVGFEKDFPAAIISSASMPDETRIITSLEEIVEKDYDQVKSPAIIVVGQVVGVLD